MDPYHSRRVVIFRAESVLHDLAPARLCRFFSASNRALHRLRERIPSLVVAAVLATLTLQPVAASAGSSPFDSKEHQRVDARDSNSQASAIPEPGPSKPACSAEIQPGEDGYCPPPVVPEAPIAALLPLNAAAVLLLAAAYLLVRRRKQGRAGG
jgi:hypothetical protein